MKPVTIDIIKSLQELAPVKPTDELLVAVSGGLDSVTLAYCCLQAGYKLKLVHCNFNLRGKESDSDEALVQKLGEEWNLPVLVRRFDTRQFAGQHKISIQEAARQLRYEWFAQLLDQGGPGNWLLTAHHSDDNAETIAMHFFRGTGLAGLTGIPGRNGRILRPFLPFSRQQIAELATLARLPFAEDSSNAKEEYTRNYFRHTLLPAIEKVFPEVKQNLLDNAARFQSIEKLYRDSVEKIIKKTIRKVGNEFHISIGQLKRYEGSSLLFEILHPYGFSPGQTSEAAKLTSAHAGAFVEAAHRPWRLIRHQNWLILAPLEKEQTAYQLIESAFGEFAFPAGFLQLKILESKSGTLPTGPQHVWIDSRGVQFPLLLRVWKEGDYFYPLGMMKKKKLSRYLIDQKKSVTQKEKIWVLESAGRIIWVVGERIDERFKVKPTTQKVLSLHFIPATD